MRKLRLICIETLFGSTNTYGPSVQIGDDKCAQLMFVIGTDGAGLTHPEWRQNFQFAITVQKIANQLYPGLFRPIIIRNARYNQHLTTRNNNNRSRSNRKYIRRMLKQHEISSKSARRSNEIKLTDYIICVIL